MGWLRRFLRTRSPDTEAVIRQAYDSMSPEVARQIVATVGGFVADRNGRPSRESELPIPKIVIELAFIKTLREWPEGPQLEAVKVLHVRLDSHFLTDEECRLLTRWDDLISSSPHPSRSADLSSTEINALVQALANDESQRAVELRQRLAEKGEERLKLNRRLRGEPPDAYSSGR